MRQRPGGAGLGPEKSWTFLSTWVETRDSSCLVSLTVCGSNIWLKEKAAASETQTETGKTTTDSAFYWFVCEFVCRLQMMSWRQRWRQCDNHNNDRRHRGRRNESNVRGSLSIEKGIP